MLRLIGYYVLFGYATWLMFIACMSLLAAHQAGKLGPTATVFGGIALVIGILMDFIFNMASILLFLELPREWLLTIRCERHLKTKDGWRFRLARWICRNLDPFQVGGHCK